MRVISRTPWAMRFSASAMMEDMRDDAEAAGVVAAFGDFDVGAGARGGEDAWCGVGVEVFGECCGGSVPGGAGESALLLAEVAFCAGFCARVGDVGDVVAGVREWFVAVGGAGLG